MPGRPSHNTRAASRAGTANRRPRIAVLLESSRAFGRGVLEGLAACIRQRRNWLVYYQEGGLGELVPRWFSAWQGDGIIARIEDRRMARMLVRKGIPVVDIRGVCPVPGIPVVKTDNQEIARLAAQHLMERGYTQFAYCGYEGAEYSARRRDAFARFVREAGHTCRIFSTREPLLAGVRQQEQYGWSHEQHLVDWLRRLPKPIAIMACNDARGHQLLNAAHQVGLAVPDEVAVVGVDNYALICELADPPLSSVEQNTQRIAREAVRLLERMLAGKPAPAEPMLVKPCKIVARRSTDALAIGDPNLRRGVQYLRERGGRGIGVADVARAAALSRRELERRFVSAFGHSPGQEKLRVRIEAVKKLLTETDWPLYRIAGEVGFTHPEYLNVAFKRHTGLTPRTYRVQMR
jgi:LacI family transcriptional regulator